MNINILSTKNGVGLEKDAALLDRILTAQGHKCFFVDVGKGGSPKAADINIFCEFFHRPNFTKMAKRNYIFPNPEWFHLDWMRNIGLMDGVLCKTLDAEDLFYRYVGAKAIHTGFTSQDMLVPEIVKSNSFFHAAGKSVNKGTSEVIEAWNKNAGLPVLTITHQMNPKIQTPPNISYNYRNYSENEFRNVLNSFQFHLCPSYYEGWGHYIHEAKSTGAIIIATNGAPMNEFISNKFGYLVPVSATKNHHLAEMKIPSIGGISESAMNCIKLSKDQITEMSALSRQSYLDGEAKFKETFLNIIEG